ncbi:MAG: hypothetical protein AAGE52_11820 [Myxococcota bacterium]
MNIPDLQPASADDEAFFPDGPGRPGLLVHDGDLHLSQHLTGQVQLLVRGSLHVEGTVAVDDANVLGVEGDLRCPHLICGGELLIDGAVHVEGLILGYNPGGRSTFDLAAARVFLKGSNHDWEVTAAERAELLVEFDDFCPAPEGRADVLGNVLTSDALEVLGDLLGIADDGDEEAIEALMKAGQVLRG